MKEKESRSHPRWGYPPGSDRDFFISIVKVGVEHLPCGIGCIVARRAVLDHNCDGYLGVCRGGESGEPGIVAGVGARLRGTCFCACRVFGTSEITPYR